MARPSTLRQVALKRAYSSDGDSILEDFYIPILSTCKQYCRLTGFFSSSALAVAARGIAGLLRNGGSMRLVACPKLPQNDVAMIERVVGGDISGIQDLMLGSLDDLADDFTRRHVEALGWMLAQGKLEIRLCVPNRLAPDCSLSSQIATIFHQKVGILCDGMGDTVTFSGSVNETGAGWLGNVEEFKVFRSWNATERDYVRTDVEKFKRFWSLESEATTTWSLPDAVADKLIEASPDDFDPDELERLYAAHRARKKQTQQRVSLFDYQKEAKEAWLQRGKCGVLAMATGTGKTFTALACVQKILDDGVASLVIVATPFQHISQQWVAETEKFGLEHGPVVAADSSHGGWKDRLADTLRYLSVGHEKNVLVFTTHDTLSSDDFFSVVEGFASKNDVMLVADEVHRLGASKLRRGLRPEYAIRLGLSATPERFFDDAGTKALLGYFGGVAYEFDLERAISQTNPATGKTFLTPFRYIPVFTQLNSAELQDYIDLTQRMVRALRGRSLEDVDDPALERLTFMRADIVKDAEGKVDALSQILDELGDDLRWTLVYSSPKRVDDVARMLSMRGAVFHRFTQAEGTRREAQYGGLSQREFLLTRFAEGEYQMLLAMKCLDEGVDVPAARTAILLSSSGNPREYIQRIGRIIRRSPGKERARVYDVIISPAIGRMPSELRVAASRIYRKEMERCRYIASLAVNSAEAMALLDTVLLDNM